MANQKPLHETALIVGAGEGLSAALARLFTKSEMRVALAARKTDKLTALCAETGARAYACDASKRGDVDSLFGAVAPVKKIEPFPCGSMSRAASRPVRKPE